MKTHFKPLLKGVLVSLWGLLLCGASVLTYHVMVKPVASEYITAQHDALTQSLTEVLKKETRQRTQAIETLVTRLDAIDQRLDAQQQQIQALLEEQRSQAQSIEALGLDSQVLKRLESKLSRLEKRMTTRSRSVARTPVKRRPSQVKASSKPLPTPPFVLFDVQKRGNVLLAIVGKSNATRLSELSALRVGQRYLGWQVTDIEMARIHTLYQGQRITVEVQA